MLQFINNVIKGDSKILKEMIGDGYLFRLGKLGLVNIDAIDPKLKQDINLEVERLLNYVKIMNNEPVSDIDRLEFLSRAKSLVENFVEYDKTIEPLRKFYYRLKKK